MNLEVTMEAGSESYEGRKYSEGWDYWESEKKYSESEVTYLGAEYKAKRLKVYRKSGKKKKII